VHQVPPCGDLLRQELRDPGASLAVRHRPLVAPILPMERQSPLRAGDHALARPIELLGPYAGSRRSLPDVFLELVYLPFQGLLEVRVVYPVEGLLARGALEERLHRLLEGPRDARGRPAVVELSRLLVV